MKPCLIAIVLAVGAFDAGAQTIFKSTMPDGKVVYGEKPAPGAQKVDKLEPPPATTGVTPVTPEEKARAANPGKKPAVAATAAREREAEEARVQLQKAEAARDAGKEPLADERVGRAGGGTRLTEEYFARQKTLDDAVDTARKRVEQTQRDR